MKVSLLLCVKCLAIGRLALMCSIFDFPTKIPCLGKYFSISSPFWGLNLYFAIGLWLLTRRWAFKTDQKRAAPPGPAMFICG